MASSSLSQYLLHEYQAACYSDESHERGCCPVVTGVYPPDVLHPAEEPLYGVAYPPERLPVEEPRPSGTLPPRSARYVRHDMLPTQVVSGQRGIVDGVRVYSPGSPDGHDLLHHGDELAPLVMVPRAHRDADREG